MADNRAGVESSAKRAVLRTREDAHNIQVSNSTRLNRYPRVFQAVGDLSRASRFAKPRVLSYGSSTGEEAHSLATSYLPDAEILGVDVSPAVVEQARAKYGSNPRIRFEISNEANLRAEAPFSVIFAMSVLCRWPESRNLDDIAEIFPFAACERQVDLLDGLLQPGGVLVIYNSSYSFLHARTSRHYDLILDPRVATSGFVKRFKKDGSYNDSVTGTDCIFRKREADAEIGPRGLTVRDHKLRVLGCIERDIAI